MEKKGKMAVSAILFSGMGIGAWMMYKKKNPCMMHDMKCMAKDMAYKVAYSLEDGE